MSLFFSRINKDLLIIAILLIIGVIAIDYGNSNSSHFQYVVSGTIINKRITKEQHCSHPEHVKEVYQITVKPYNLDIYKIYTVNTTQDTYINNKIGNHIAFNMAAYDVLKSPPSKFAEFLEAIFPILVGLICFLTAFVFILANIF